MNFLLALLFIVALLPTGAISQADSESKRKKRNHKRIINAILRCRDRNNLYGMLGLPNNRFLRIPERFVTIIPNTLTVHIPEMTFLYISKKQIKKAFRERALAVHPDKTADARAEEAFNAIDEAAQILLDDISRAKYDRSITMHRQKRRAEINAKLVHGAQSAQGLAQTCLQGTRKVLGPFTVPAIVMSFLIF